MHNVICDGKVVTDIMINNNIKRQETVGNSESKQVEYSGVFKTRNELKVQAISSIFLLHRNINDHFPFNVN